jgi:hypothetical protein
MIKKELTQSADRYSKTPTGWIVSASKDIQPIVLERGSLPTGLVPVLKADGIVVKVDEWLLCSPATLSEILNPANPHYDIVSNGVVRTTSGLTTTIGRTIPQITLTTESLKKLAEGRDILNKNAGVESVDYIYEGPKTAEGIPLGLIEQINSTIAQSEIRPEDGFSLWNLSLSADYSIEKLNIQTAQAENVFDQTKLDAFLAGINTRLKGLRADFNMIKEVFYNANPPANKGKVAFKLRAQPDTDTNQNHTVVFKYTDTVETKTSQAQAVAQNAAETAAAVVKTKEELAAQITTQSEELKRAQSGDSAAQSRLAQELQRARADSAALRTALKAKNIIQ